MKMFHSGNTETKARSTHSHTQETINVFIYPWNPKNIVGKFFHSSALTRYITCAVGAIWGQCKAWVTFTLEATYCIDTSSISADTRGAALVKILSEREKSVVSSPTKQLHYSKLSFKAEKNCVYM